MYIYTRDHDSIFFESFKVFVYVNKLYKDGLYMCPTCDGTSSIYDPDDPRDPIEGNKLRNIIKCPTCDSKGYGHFESHWRNYYNTDTKLKKEQLKTEKKNARIRRAALKKLTKEEKEVLGLAN